MTVLVVIVARLLVPLTIFRWPFWGGIATMLVDLGDFVFFQRFGWGWLEGKDLYQHLDKLFDLYYLTIELCISLQWTETLLRRLSVSLFIWRLIGTLLFEITGTKLMLLIFANVFENLFLIVEGLKRYTKNINLTQLKTVSILFLLACALKLPQEYHLHVHPIEPVQTILDQYANKYLW